MATCALVGAAAFNSYHFLKQEFDCIIAVDAGFGHLEKIGVDPDYVIGDFDSLGYVPDRPTVIGFPERKDETDIELALDFAVKKGYRDLMVYGCLGGRLDFSYAVFQLISRFAEAGNTVFAIGMDSIVTALVGGVKSSIAFSEKAQGTLSLFAASEYAVKVDETGLSYTLDQATLRRDTPVGISNEFCGEASSVSVGKGTALLFFSIEAWDSLVSDRSHR